MKVLCKYSTRRIQEIHDKTGSVVWRVRETIAAVETEQCVLRVLLIYRYLSTIQKQLIVTMKMQKRIALPCCRVTKYFVLLFTVQTYSGLRARRIFVKVSNVKVHENTFRGSSCVLTNRWTDRRYCVRTPLNIAVIYCKTVSCLQCATCFCFT
jgi:hypothetical protein